MEQMKLDLKPYKAVIDKIESACQKRDAAAAAFERAKSEFRQAFSGKTFLDELRRVRYSLLNIWQEGRWFAQAANGKTKDDLSSLMDRCDLLLRRLELEA